MRPTLVGRDAELDQLVECLRRTPGGPSALVVEGPAGVGKSGLVTEAVRRAFGDRGHDIRKAVGRSGDSGNVRSLIRQLGVEIESDIHDKFEGDLDLDAVAMHLASAWGQPRVVIIEEAHLVPAPVLGLVHAAVLASPDRPVLVLVARPEPRIDIRDAHRLRLTGLPLPAVVDLVRSRHDAPGDAVARTVWSLTAGLPGDVLDLLAETPPQVWAERPPVLTATRHHRQRIARLRSEIPEESWTLLLAVAVVASVTGDVPAGATGTTTASASMVSVDLAFTAALAGVAPEAVDPLVTGGVVTISARPGTSRVLMDHPMTALAVRDIAGPGVVRELHHRAVGHTDDPGRRLRHLVAATVGGDDDLAARLADHATVCGDAGQWGQAARAYCDAAQVARGDVTRARYLADALDAYVGAGEIPPAVDLVPELENHARTPRTDASLGYLSILRGRNRDAQVYLTRAWSGAAGRHAVDAGASREGSDSSDPSGDRDDELAALVCTRWVLHSLVSGDGRGLVEWADRAREHGGPTSVYAMEAAAIRGLGLGAQGRDDEAVAAFDVAYSLVSSTAQTQRVTMGRGWFDLLADDPLAARSALESAVSADYSHGSARIALWAQAWLARTLFVLGRWDESLEVTRRAERAVDASGHEVIRPLMHWPAAVIHAYRGAFDQAESHLRAGSAADHEYVAMWLPAAVARGQVAESRADYAAVTRALDPVAAALADPERDPGMWPWRDIYGGALVLTGRLDEAESVLDVALASAEQRRRRSEIARAETMRGRLYGARGEIDAAVDSFDRAGDLLAGLPMPVETARLLFVRGQVLRRAGRRREADEVMRAARDAFGRLGASPYLARCDRELKTSGAERLRGMSSGGSGSGSGIASLTPQEVAVVDLVASGRTNKEVAGELYISVKTVQYHLTRVYAKLGLRSRSELAAHVAAAQHDRTSPASTAEPQPSSMPQPQAHPHPHPQPQSPTEGSS